MPVAAEKTVADINRDIEQSKWLAKILIEGFVGLPTAVVIQALVIVIAYAIKNLSVNGDQKATLALLTQCVENELCIDNAFAKE